MSVRSIRKALRNPAAQPRPGGPVILKKGLGVDKVYYLRENQSSFPGVSVAAGLHPRVQGRDRGGAPLRQRRRGHGPAAQGAALRRASLRATRSASRASSTSTTASCAAGPAPTGSRSTRSGGRPQQLRSTPAQPGDDVRLTIDSGLQSYGGGRARLLRPARRLRRDERARRRDPRDGLGADLRPVDLHPPDHPEPVPRTSPRGRPTHPSRTGRSRASIRRARPSSRSPRPPRCRTT